jgi:hypothetical protein
MSVIPAAALDVLEQRIESGTNGVIIDLSRLRGLGVRDIALCGSLWIHLARRGVDSVGALLPPGDPFAERLAESAIRIFPSLEEALGALLPPGAH